MMRGRWLVFWLGVIAWFVAASAWISNDPRLTSTAYDVFSSYNTSPGGMSQAFSYLHTRRGGGVHRLLSGVGNIPSNATILRIDPTDDMVGSTDEAETEKKSATKGPVPTKQITPLLDPDEEEWVRYGGRFVFGLTAPYRQVETTTAECREQRQVFPTQPSMPAIDEPHCRSLAGPALQQHHSVVLNGNSPVLTSARIGGGELILFSMPEALSNEYLAKNLELLERLAGPGRSVYFDETVHGHLREGSIGDLLIRDWALGPALILFALAALLELLRRARPIGIPDRPARDVRSDAIDLVDSIGLLYDRTVDHAEALRLHYHGLLRVVHARTGLTGDSLERAVRDRTPGYDPSPRFQDMSREDFQRMLTILNHAYETVGYAKPR